MEKDCHSHHRHRRSHKIIATFAKATPPSVWCLNLEPHDQVFFTVQGQELVMALPDGTKQLIAHFQNAEDAKEALLRVGKTLGQHRGCHGRAKCLIATFGIFILGMAFACALHGWMKPYPSQMGYYPSYGSYRPRSISQNLPFNPISHPAPVAAQPPATPQAEAAPEPPKPEPPVAPSKMGIPLPADEVLKAPKVEAPNGVKAR